MCVAKFLALSPASSFLIDGEVVIARDDGTPDFHALRSRRRGHEAVLYAFDLIEHDGDDLRDLPLIDRKWRLKNPVDCRDGPRGAYVLLGGVRTVAS